MSPLAINLKTTLFDAPWTHMIMNRNNVSMQKVRQLIMGTFSKDYATSNKNVKARERSERYFRCFVFRSSTDQGQIDFSSIFSGVLCILLH